MHEAELYNLAALPCIYCLKGFVEVNYRSPIHLKPLLNNCDQMAQKSS